MADLIAIGYPDTATAPQAEDEVQRLAKDLVIQPDAVAAIIRNEKGHIKTITNHHPVGKGATWGLFWGFLFGLLFFVPFFGMAIGAGIGALMGNVRKAGVDEVSKYGGTILKTSLSKDAEKQLQEALHDEQPS